jgi:hypothetical protein
MRDESADQEQLRLKLMSLAAEFREAMETIARVPCGVPDVVRHNFKAFPKDMCERTSNLLGRYLRENGIESAEYVCRGRRKKSGPGNERHAWLEVCGLVIDITADQFPDQREPVIVTADHSWHSTFCHPEERRDAGDLSGYLKTVRDEQYCRVYPEVVKRIPRRSGL